MFDKQAMSYLSQIRMQLLVLPVNETMIYFECVDYPTSQNCKYTTQENIVNY